MIADRLLTRLDRVRQTGPNQWSACCPSHDDRSPSLGIKELPDGRLLIRCHAGCDADEIVSAVSLSLSDLYPPRMTGQHYNGRRERLITATQGLAIVANETLVAAVIATDIAKGKAVIDNDIDRLWRAVGRVNAVYAEVAL
jgi:hypothetical protein